MVARSGGGSGAEPGHARLVVGVAAVGQGLEHARIHVDRCELRVPEPVGEQIVHALGDVGTAVLMLRRTHPLGLTVPRTSTPEIL